MNHELTASLPTHLSAFTWRPVQYADIPALREMLEANREIDRSESVPSEERLRGILGMLGDQLETNTLVAIAEDGSLIAEAMILIPPGEGEALALVDGNVHVNYRGWGIGGYLLKWLEWRARQELNELETGMPTLMRTSCTGGQADRIALFKRNGYQAKRYSYQMRRSLADPIQEMALPAGLKWAQWTPELDLPLIHAFNETFSGHWGLQTMNEAAWKEFFTGVPQFRGDLSYLAMEADSIVGFCVNWVEDNESTQEGWIEAIGVIPAWRGQGVASALLTKTLKLFQAERLPRAALDVDAENPTGALRLYEELGFEVARETIHFVKRLK